MTPGFQSLPLKVATRDGHNFVLLEPFSYVTAAGELITVPAGAESDGASTPKMIWNSIPPFGVYWPAAFLHDYLYRHTDRAREACDKLFLEAMEALGTPLLERETIYEGVRIGGGVAFVTDRSKPNT